MAGMMKAIPNTEGFQRRIHKGDEKPGRFLKRRAESACWGYI